MGGRRFSRPQHITNQTRNSLPAQGRWTLGRKRLGLDARRASGRKGGGGYFTIHAATSGDIHVPFASGCLHSEVSLPRSRGAGKRSFLTGINARTPYIHINLSVYSYCARRHLYFDTYTLPPKTQMQNTGMLCDAI